MNNNPKTISEETNLLKIGNLIKIPNYDLIEETNNHPPFYIDGFSVIEINEENKDLFQFEDIPDIETKNDFLLKKKANIVENYYMNYSDEELFNVHCSKCYMNGFHKNELLYFKDRKTLIYYLKYCFIFLKKSLFMNHTIYMNNIYDLFEIDHTYFIGFHFLIPKTICKSCFIQLINKEYLLSRLKNEISDFDQRSDCVEISPKKNINLLQKKRKRNEGKKNSEKKNKEPINDNEEGESSIKSIQISPIIIPLSNKHTPKKKTKDKKNISKYCKIRKKRNNKYNKNVVYDIENNLLIINKNVMEQKKEIENSDNLIFKSKNKDNIKFKLIVNKDEEKKKLGDNYKIVKDININIKKENNIKKDKNGKNVENKSTIIINKISNGVRGVNMNKIDLVQKNNIINKQLNNKQNMFIPINQILVPNIFIFNKQKIMKEIQSLFEYTTQLFAFSNYFYKIIEDYSIFNFTNNINLIRTDINMFFKIFKEIEEKINENRILGEYAICRLRENLEINPKIKDKEKKIKDYNEFIIIMKMALKFQEDYKFLVDTCLDGLNHMNNNIEEINNFNLKRNNQKI